ncbi:MAG: alpha/beta hydrolase [Candidatus Manganitrophus sp. SA1]|nr:alpha/beta hydrolase [Candidatus Manganitrophus morganii]
MPYLTVDRENSGNVDLYYEDHGSGPPVVLIHGWPLSGASWEKQVPVLLEAGYRVIQYDRRGFGKSSQPAFGYHYDTLATDLYKLIMNLDLHDISLVGFSTGGGEVARYLGAHGSQRVSKAVFMSAVPPFLLKAADNPDGVDSSVFEGIKQAIVADRPAFLAKFMSDFYNIDQFKEKKVSDEVVHLNWIIAAGASPIGTVECVTAWKTDFRNDLRQIDIPTLVMHGDADRIVPFPASGKRTPEFVKGAKLIVVNGGPHGINWTHAEKVNSDLLAFLGEAARKKAAA